MTSDRGSKLRHQPRMIVIQLNRYVDKVHRMCTSRRWNPPRREAVRRGIILTKAMLNTVKITRVSHSARTNISRANNISKYSQMCFSPYVTTALIAYKAFKIIF